MRNFNRNNFFFKTASFDSCNCTFLRLHSKVILVFTCNSILFSNVFSCNSHMEGFKGICQAITKHSVYYLRVSHTSAPTLVWKYIRSLAHVFSPTGYNDISISTQYSLSRQLNCFQTRSTNFVNSESWRSYRDTCVNTHLASYILTKTCTQNIPHDNFINLFWFQICSFNSTFNN